jgi:hypothetical protein
MEKTNGEGCRIPALCRFVSLQHCGTFAKRNDRDQNNIGCGGMRTDSFAERSSGERPMIQQLDL